VGVETIRYYQRRGLMMVPPRGRGVRRYGEADLRRLHFIRAAQAAGFALAEIADLLALDAGQDRARARTLAAARIAVLDGEIAARIAARDALKRLARDCRAGTKGPCPILAAFERE
jgi:MerR family mercuric resistance operon transcriptional regulator